MNRIMFGFLPVALLGLLVVFLLTGGSPRIFKSGVSPVEVRYAGSLTLLDVYVGVIPVFIGLRMDRFPHRTHRRVCLHLSRPRRPRRHALPRGSRAKRLFNGARSLAPRLLDILRYGVHNLGEGLAVGGPTIAGT